MHDHAALALDARVSGGGERVLEHDLDVAAPERRAAGDVVARAAAGGRARCSTTSSAGRRRRPGGCRSRRGAIGAAPRGRRAARSRRAAAQVLQRAARDPQQEQVEDGEEAELQADGDGFEHPAGLLDHEPDVGGAERDAVAGLERRRAADRRPLTFTPFVDAEVRDGPAAAAGRADLRVAARDVGVGEHDVAVAAAAEHRAAGGRRPCACPRRAPSRAAGRRRAGAGWSSSSRRRSEVE